MWKYTEKNKIYKNKRVNMEQEEDKKNKTDNAKKVEES